MCGFLLGFFVVSFVPLIWIANHNLLKKNNIIVQNFYDRKSDLQAPGGA